MRRRIGQVSNGTGARGDSSRSPTATGEPGPNRQVESLQGLAGNRAVGKLLGRNPRLQRDPDPRAIPPKRPKVTGTRTNDDQWIKETSISRKQPTFGQIFLAVRDAQVGGRDNGPDCIYEHELVRLDLSELQTLDRLAQRRFEYFALLGKRQAADPAFEPPEGEPDIFFTPAARQLRAFHEGMLADVLKKRDRRARALGLIEPWAQAAWEKFGDEPFGRALNNSITAARLVVEARLAGNAYEFGPDGVRRYGYIPPAAVAELETKAAAEGLDRQGAMAQFSGEIISAILSHKAILPLKVADAMLHAGQGLPDDASEFLKRMEGVANDIGLGLARITQQRVGTSPFSDSDAPEVPANMLFNWCDERSQKPPSVYHSYAGFLANANKTPSPF